MIRKPQCIRLAGSEEGLRPPVGRGNPVTEYELDYDLFTRLSGFAVDSIEPSGLRSLVGRGYERWNRVSTLAIVPKS
jgi:hypothetical protein